MSNKLRYIDVSRGLAILMVIFVHTGASISDLPFYVKKISEFGQMGVQFFFVASAFTMCFSYQKNSDKSRKILNFYIRRYFRIAPLYYFAIALYFGLKIFSSYYTHKNLALDHYSLGNVFSNIFFVHGLVESSNNIIVPGGWSIGAEMLFYAVFPWIFIAISKTRDNLKLFYSILFVMGCISFVISFFSGNFFGGVKNNEFSYFFIANQLPVFIFGFFSYYASIDFNWNKGILLVGILISFAVSFYGFCEFNRDQFFLVTFIVGMLFSFVIIFFKKINFSNNTLDNFGRHSYSIYICHFVFIYYLLPFSSKFLGMYLWASVNLVVNFVFMAIISLVLARILSIYIEDPGINLGKNFIGFLNGFFVQPDRPPTSE